jgi:predicted GIY-YIG superfamily endonuclease
MVFIYVLHLENGKYYIGKTNQPAFRIEQHTKSNGSAWTKKYKPVTVIEILSNCDDYDEDKNTIKYMEKYGVNNVRGGSFCEIRLSDDNITTLNQMIRGVTDKCYICGKSDHFAINCKNHNIKKAKIPTINVNEKCDCPTSFFSPHRRGKCLLNKIISYFDDEDDNIDKLVIKQEEYGEKLKLENTTEEPLKREVISCFRCGREGHYASSCYASKHIKGYYLKKKVE